VLVEHYAWCVSGVACAGSRRVVVPVAPAFDEYAEEVAARLFDAGYRFEADLSDNRMNAKIRNAQTQKVPYMLVVGENEREANAVSVRTRTGERLDPMSVDAFLEMIASKVAGKELI
jgi:threonyl-tRNA synthetase